MTALEWDLIGERFYEKGVSKGVLYPFDPTDKTYEAGVAWNGLTNVNSTPSGAEPSPMYADNIKYANPLSAEEYGGTIEAFTYPKEFERCDGSFSKNGINVGQQGRVPFAFSWRTEIGSDTDDNAGYKIHIAYGATAQPSEKGYGTINDTPEAITLSWTFTTTPVSFPAANNTDNLKPTAYLSFSSLDVDASIMRQIEASLYGTADGESKLLLPHELLALTPGAGAGADAGGGE